VKIQNRFVIALLRSPLHRALSRSVDVIRFRGRRTGREVVTPTQYVRHGDDVVILVGRPGSKTWWRNFRNGHDLDVLLNRRWVPMRGQVIVGDELPDAIVPLLDAYLERFPSSRRSLTDGARSAVIVLCSPRNPVDQSLPRSTGEP
jgi:hypothetical protein